MKIEITRSTLRTLKVIGIVLLLLLIGVGGYKNTPRDNTGLPLLLSPRRRAIRQYLKQVETWTSRMKEAGKRLDHLMPKEVASKKAPPLPTPPAPENAPSNLYQRASKARRAKSILEQIAAEMEVTKPPESLRGLRDLTAQALEAYLAWADGTLIYVGSPEESSLKQLTQLRNKAYVALKRLKGAQ